MVLSLMGQLSALAKLFIFIYKLEMAYSKVHLSNNGMQLIQMYSVIVFLFICQPVSPELAYVKNGLFKVVHRTL